MLQGNRVVFNIAGNHYRIVAKIITLIESFTYALWGRIKNMIPSMSQ